MFYTIVQFFYNVAHKHCHYWVHCKNSGVRFNTPVLWEVHTKLVYLQHQSVLVWSFLVLISTSVSVSLIPRSHQPVLNLTPRKIKLTLTGVVNNTNLVWTSHNTGGVKSNTRVFAVDGVGSWFQAGRVCIRRLWDFDFFLKNAILRRLKKNFNKSQFCACQ